MRVTFKNSYEVERDIGFADSYEEAYKIIDKFLDDHNYKSYYKRITYHDNFIWVDVGSWTEFFYIYF